MPLSMNDNLKLRGAGFTQYEVDEFNNATATDGSPQVINLSSGTWQDMLRSRKEWTMAMASKFDKDEIENRIDRHYQDPGHSPFDFVKREYRPPRTLSDYAEARQARAEANTDELYEDIAWEEEEE